MKFFDRLFSGKNETQVLHAHAAVGNSFTEFAGSDEGRYMIGRAEQDEIDTLRELGKVDPNDTVKIIQLQERAASRAAIIDYIEQVINEGEAAKFQMDEITAHESGY